MRAEMTGGRSEHGLWGQGEPSKMARASKLRAACVEAVERFGARV